jgi:hypothetical protein
VALGQLMPRALAVLTVAKAATVMTVCTRCRRWQSKIGVSRGTLVQGSSFPGARTDAAGLRWGEMAALHIRDADMLRRRVQVRQAVAEVRGRLA